jgi:L,D-transpeptidase catalytic domain
MNLPGRRQFIQNMVFGATAAAAATTPLARALASGIEHASLTPLLKQQAIAAFQKHRALITNPRIIAIADFTVGSGQPRFHLLDMESGASNALLVSHGRGSDPDHSGWVQSFSNVHGSNATSSGAYLCGESYFGQHGMSRRLAGLDPENDQAEARAIVIHPANYVSQAIADEKGKVGRSQGCFAFSESDIGHVLWRLQPGTMIYAGKA